MKKLAISFVCGSVLLMGVMPVWADPQLTITHTPKDTACALAGNPYTVTFSAVPDPAPQSDDECTVETPPDWSWTQTSGYGTLTGSDSTATLTATIQDKGMGVTQAFGV